MTKTEIDYIRGRVNNVVKCTNGVIATKQEKKKKSTGLSNGRKLAQIRSGKATLIDDFKIANIDVRWKEPLETLLKFYDYEITENQKEKIKHNERIDCATEDLQQSVELAGERLIDEVVLGLIDVSELPMRLEKLSRMSSNI